MPNPISSNQLTLRPADASDCADLFAWRNDPSARRMSLDGRAIDWSAHEAWFTASLSSETRLILIGEIPHGKVGVVRFDRRVEDCEVSINLNPAFRGQGLSAALLTASIEHAARVLGDRLFKARIKPENAASSRIFAQCGFQRIGGAGDHDDYRLTLTRDCS